MSTLNLLDVGKNVVTLYSQNLSNVPLTGITKLVANIIEFFSFGGIIAIGIIMFSLLLKIIPLPLDIFSRVSTKKNALKMEKMRPELEKLQKQYANNKELYNQKLIALYKKEGYSQFAACLPSIFTLVFFIIVITAFNQYSTYAKVKVFNEMAIAYDECIKEELTQKKIEGTDKYVIEIDENGNYIFEGEITPNDKESDYYKLVVKPAQDRAAEKYFEEAEKHKFLWVKNIWIGDLPWNKAFIERGSYTQIFTYQEGCSTTTIKNNDIKRVEVYDVLMGSDKLDEVKNQSNGYLILVLLSVGSMLLSQFVMTKSQKAQMELQSVDGANGQAAQTSKMMMWIMPIMFGIFSFMYTASFSIYLIISTVFSMVSTILINKVVEVKFKKKMEKIEEEKYNKRYGHLKNNKGK